MRIVYPIVTDKGVKLHAVLDYDRDGDDTLVPDSMKLMVLTSADGEEEKWVEVDHYEEIFALPGGGNGSISINLNETRDTFDG